MTVSQPSGSTPQAAETQRLALQELVARLGCQVDAAHSEIGETRAILKDAVERLMPAFTAMRCNETTGADLPGKLSESMRTTRANRASGAAFSALQFQDISDQLLAHAQVRLTSLLAEVNSIATALNHDATGQSKIDNFLQTVTSANDKLAALEASLVKPVGKDHLGTGDMEVF